MGPGSEILMQLEKHHQPTPTGCGSNSSVGKNNKNSNSHQPKNNKKSDKKAANVHDEAKKSTAATTAATATTPNTNNRENKKKSAKTAKSNLTSSYPPYNAKSKPIPVKRSNSQDAGGVLSLQNHVMKAPKNFVNANPASRYSPVKGGPMIQPITPSTRPSSWTPTNQSQSPGKVFYAGAKFEAHPTTSAGLPTPPPHWTTLASATPQPRSHSQPSTPTINDKFGQSPAIDLASLFGSLNASINKPSSTPVAKSFQGETSIGKKRNQAESESSDEEMKEIFSDGEKKKVVSKKEVVPSVIVQGVVTPKKEQPRSILDNTCQGSAGQLGSLKEMSDQLKSLMKVAA